MSIHRIPERYLNTTIHIFRESAVVDAVGDQDISLNLAYYSVKANVQPRTSDVDFEIQGRIHRQTHAAYFNRVEDEDIRQIQAGDIVLDEETGERYIALGIEVQQASNRRITDSHHIKLNLKTMTGQFEGLVKFQTTQAKAKIT